MPRVFTQARAVNSFLSFFISGISSNQTREAKITGKVLRSSFEAVRISKPGLRVYAGKDELPRVLGGLGIAIISTNQGVVTDRKARELQVGGEVLAFVW